MAQAKPAPPRRRQTTGQLSGIQVMFAAILSIGLLLALNFSARIAETQPLQEAYARVLDEIDQLEEEQIELMRQRDYVRSDAYVMQWARSDGKMHRPGDVLVVPMPAPGDEAAEAPAEIIVGRVQTTPPDPEPWTLWWSLFFDAPPPTTP